MKKIVPDAQLVYEAERAISGANIHVVQKALKWYLHCCEIGNASAVATSASVLREEIRKARQNPPGSRET